jgi:hypothetical protein
MASPDSTQPQQRTCFVVMGFGKKTDFETGRILDLDKSYLNMIKPAVEAAGLKCIRADEIVHSGLIDVPMYEQLLNADVVVADLSTSNKNAFYELGVRHALRPFTTIIVAEDGIKTFPFDINHVAVRQYHHLGEDIGYGEVMRFQKMLTESIKQIVGQESMSSDSPVYTFLRDLVPPAIQKLQEAALAAAADSGPMMATAAPAGAAEAAAMTHSMLMAEVDEAQGQGDWAQTKSLLEIVRRQQAKSRALLRQGATVAPTQPDQEDPYILQRLALATYKAGLPTEAAALQAARDILLVFEPHTSNDTETLGQWGAIHKRRWALAKRTGADGAADLDEAIRAYERGFYLRNDYYNGINLAFMLNVRAAEAATPADAIADFVQARRVRQEVAGICEQWLAARAVQSGPAVAADPKNQADRYWVLATQAEAYVGLGLEEQAAKALAEASALAPQPGMKESTDGQLAKLRELLAVNPLQFIKAT